ncbi:tautomerase family protein [Luteibacter aegosomaticola]|uniref:tautomerase family protein n=1 Tax=Luteibacter aegosomaticola TaxID=2911538 RepID=UPI001FF92DAB|nr:tautomerase family protein [Luteibacter aegosomaticola]UPG92199.1 tautomerase family protein [Luteibacter aegosomaticola]
MPLVRIDIRRGKSAEYIAALKDGIYAAMRENFQVPENDRFMLVSQYEAEEFDYHPSYLDIQRSDDLVIVQITANNTRGVEQKKAFYRAVVDKLVANPGVRPEDVLINLVETAKENWSFGNGVATYAT